MSDNANASPTGIEGLDVEVMQIPVISTTHISKATSEALAAGQHPWVHHCARYEFGWFISVPTEDFQMSLDPPPPVELQELFAWARLNKFGWIRLDSDGSHVEVLKTFDW